MFCFSPFACWVHSDVNLLIFICLPPKQNFFFFTQCFELLIRVYFILCYIVHTYLQMCLPSRWWAVRGQRTGERNNHLSLYNQPSVLYIVEAKDVVVDSVNEWISTIAWSEASVNREKSSQVLVWQLWLHRAPGNQAPLETDQNQAQSLSCSVRFHDGRGTPKTNDCCETSSTGPPLMEISDNLSRRWS